MKNTLSIQTHIGGSVQTDIVTYDHVSCMEIHRVGLYESKVLEKLVEKKYYQHIKGSWEISFPDDNWSTTQTTFDKAVEAAQMHIFSRDNNISYDGFA